MGAAVIAAELCAYCQKEPAVTKDHVVPKTFLRKGHAWSNQRRKALRALDPSLLKTVPACYTCNLRKATRKLVPASWEGKIPLLKQAIPGPWRVWNGDPQDAAYREVHV